MSGTVNISRDLWDDPAFRNEPFSQREAWVWMIAEASWKKRTRRVGSYEVETERGQLAASTRFLAKAWSWAEPRVRRYLDMLENRRMISRVTDAGVTVITICKYDDYQGRPRVGDAPSTQQPTQNRRTTDANEKKGERRGKGSADADHHQSSFDHFWKKWPNKVSKQDARKAWKKLSLDDQRAAYSAVEFWWQSWRSRNPQASPIHAASYLNRRRWEDEPPPLTAIPGGRNDRSEQRQQFDSTLRETTRRLRAGEIDFGTDDDDFGP